MNQRKKEESEIIRCKRESTWTGDIKEEKNIKHRRKYRKRNGCRKTLSNFEHNIYTSNTLASSARSPT